MKKNMNLTALKLTKLIIERLKEGYETAKLEVLTASSLTISFCTLATPCCSPTPHATAVCLTACTYLSQVSSSLVVHSFYVNSHSEHLKRITIATDRVAFQAFRLTQPASIGEGVVDTSPGRKGAAPDGPVGPVAGGKKRKDAGE